MRYRFMRFPGGKQKAVTLSYDDGVPEDKKFSDIITGYNLKCTFNLNGDVLRKDYKLSTDEVYEYILDRGHEIAVHGMMHRAEGLLRPIEGIKDVLDCRRELEKKYRRIIRGMAYPDSGITKFENHAEYEKIKNYLTELDIAYARTLGSDNMNFTMPDDWHRWMPTVHHSNPDVMDYVDKFVDLDFEKLGYLEKKKARLFYMWGHSYEFERNNNWDLAEKICEKLGNKDDTWYATNMEIYEYEKAYSSLVYSAEEDMVYNPTLIDVWFLADDEEYCVKSGEKLFLQEKKI